MTNPTRQEIIEAHQVVKDYIEHELDVAHNEADIKEALRRDELLLKFLPPLPRLTMAEIEWDDNEHFLAEAENRAWGKVIMLFKKAKTGKILSLFHEDGEQCFVYLDPCDLAPTGRRYVLQEGE